MVPIEPIVFTLIFKANSLLEHLIIRTNLVGLWKFKLSELHFNECSKILRKGNYHASKQ